MTDSCRTYELHSTFHELILLQEISSFFSSEICILNEYQHVSPTYIGTHVLHICQCMQLMCTVFCNWDKMKYFCSVGMTIHKSVVVSFIAVTHFKGRSTVMKAVDLATSTVVETRSHSNMPPPPPPPPPKNQQQESQKSNRTETVVMYWLLANYLPE